MRKETADIDIKIMQIIRITSEALIFLQLAKNSREGASEVQQHYIAISIAYLTYPSSR